MTDQYVREEQQIEYENTRIAQSVNKLCESLIQTAAKLQKGNSINISSTTLVGQSWLDIPEEVIQANEDLRALLRKIDLSEVTVVEYLENEVAVCRKINSSESVKRTGLLSNFQSMVKDVIKKRRA